MRLSFVTRLASSSTVLAVVMAGTAQCGTSPSSDPFGHCPPGSHRMRDVTRPPQHQWVCV